MVVDGCPPRLPLTDEHLQADLDRRRPGQSSITTQRSETDRGEILSGVFEGVTTGSPIAVLVRNSDARPGAYEHLRDVYRPSHADFTYDAVAGLLGPLAHDALARNETVPGLRRTRDGSPLSTLVRLFLLQVPVGLSAAEAAPIVQSVFGTYACPE